jgi:hypothetical protein
MKDLNCRGLSEEGSTPQMTRCLGQRKGSEAWEGVME